MATQHNIVFAVTSSGCDFYSAMTRVAIASIRISNPSITICVCCDAETDLACRNSGDPLIYEVDHWLPQSTPHGHASFRNRFLKTRLRNTLEGTFLFLDSDVLVRGDLTPLFAMDTDVAGARNHSLENSKQIYAGDAETLQVLDWDVRSDVYINGGVLLYQDTVAAHQFAEEWHLRWLYCYEKRQNHRDQPALNAALLATQVKLHLLPDRYNAQFKKNLQAIPDAILWHYYADGIGERPATLFELMVRDLMQGKPLELEHVEQLVSAPHPWRTQNGLGNLALSKGLRRGYCRGWELAILRRDVPGYLCRIMSSLFTNLKCL